MKNQNQTSANDSKEGKSAKTVREELDQREENLRDNKLVNDDDPNLGRGKYQSKQGDGKSNEPSTKGGETD